MNAGSPRPDRRCHGESGQAAGLETIPFGILVFIGGLLLVVNVWAVVDTRAAVDGSARDYLRAYTSAADSATARLAGGRSAERSMSARTLERPMRIVHPPEPFGPCRPATVTISIDVPLIRAPFIGAFGTSTVTATQTELVQPYGRARDEGPTGPSPCDG